MSFTLVPTLARCGLFIGPLHDGPLKATHDIQRRILQHQQASVLQEVIFVLPESLADRASLVLSFLFFLFPIFLPVHFIFTLREFPTRFLSGLALHTPTFTIQILEGGLLNDPK